MNTYKPIDFVNIIRKINCMPFDKFYEMYKYAFNDPFLHDSYVMEKYQSAMRNGIANWICYIDEEYLNRMFEFCMNN